MSYQTALYLWLVCFSLHAIYFGRCISHSISCFFNECLISWSLCFYCLFSLHITSLFALSSASSTFKYWGERGLQIAHVCLYRGWWARFAVMRGLELGFLILLFHSASYVLEGVFHVLGEWAQRFIVADFGWVRWFEGLVVLHQRWGLLARLTSWIRSIFSDGGFIRVEKFSASDFLREWFLLHEGISCQTLLSGQFFRSVVVVLHVVDSPTKSSVFADLTKLGRIGLNVSWLWDDLSVFWVTEVLFDLLVVLHVLVGRIYSLLYELSWPEWFLVSNLYLSLSVLLAHHRLCCVLEWVTNRIVRCLHEEDGVSMAFLHGACPDVRRINHDFLHVLIWGNSGYSNRSRMSVRFIILRLDVFDRESCFGC